MGEAGKTQGKDLTMSVLSPDQTLEGVRQSPASCTLLPSSVTQVWVPAKKRAPGRLSGLWLPWSKVSALHYVLYRLRYTSVPGQELWAMGRTIRWQCQSRGGPAGGKPITRMCSKWTALMDRAWSAGNSESFGFGLRRGVCGLYFEESKRKIILI